MKNMQDNFPLVSIIIPTYNRPEMLVEAIQSVLNQSYNNFEVIVINDAGINIENLISPLNEKGNILYIRQNSNKGLAVARNTGIKNANGKYIAYLDDDDIFYAKHIETLVSHLETNDCHVAYTDAYRAIQIWQNNKYDIIKKDLPYSCDFDYDRILIENYIPVLCIMHRKECIDNNNVGMFDENLLRTEDWDLWIRMSRLYKFSHIKEITCEFRWKDDGTTMVTGEKLEFFWATLNMFHKYTTLVKDKSDIIKIHNAIVTDALKRLEDAAEESLYLPDEKMPRLFCNDSIERTIMILHSLKKKYPDNLLAINRIIDFLNKRVKVILTSDELGKTGTLPRNLKSRISEEIRVHEQDEANGKAMKNVSMDYASDVVQKTTQTKINGCPNSYTAANSSGYPQDMVIFYERRIKNLEERLNIFLNIFYNSNGGKLLLKYYQFRDRFFPEKSIRKEILNYILRFTK